MEDNIKFFETPEAFRKWLKVNHGKSAQLWVGYYKKGSGLASIDWPQSVDEALCFGWIDGIRKRIDDQSYKIRFTPRKAKSHWSRVNIEKVKKLKTEGLMEKAGLDAFANLDPKNSELASFEQKRIELPKAFENIFRANERAWDYFQKIPSGYRKQSIWYVIQAKREETKLKRLKILIHHSELEERIPPLQRGVI